MEGLSLWWKRLSLPRASRSLGFQSFWIQQPSCIHVGKLESPNYRGVSEDDMTLSVASGDPGCPEKSWKNKLSASVFTLPGNRQGNSVPQMFPGCDGGPEKATG